MAFKLHRNLPPIITEFDLAGTPVAMWPGEAIELARSVLAANLPEFYLQLPALRRAWLASKVEALQQLQHEVERTL